MDENAMDERALYEALPPDKQREFDRLYQQAQETAKKLRAAREHYAAMCDAVEAALRAKAPTYDAGDNAGANRESALRHD